MYGGMSLTSVKYSDAIYSGKIKSSSVVLNEHGVSMVSSLIYSFIYNRNMKEGDTIYLGLPFYRFTLPEISASCGNAKFDIAFRNAGKVNCSLMLNITSGIINSSSYCS